MSRPRKIRTEVPGWVASEVLSAAGDFLDEFVATECPYAIPCLRKVADELRKADPSWEAICGSIRAARRASPRRYRLNFNRLEARLANFFSGRKHEWAKPREGGDE